LTDATYKMLAIVVLQ